MNCMVPWVLLMVTALVLDCGRLSSYGLVLSIYVSWTDVISLPLPLSLEAEPSRARVCGLFYLHVALVL